MPRRKKPKKIKLFNNEKAVEDFFNIIFGVGKKVYDNITKKSEGTTTIEVSIETAKQLHSSKDNTPPKAEKVAPPLPTFMQETKTSHERLLEQKNVAKQLLKRLG